MQVAQVIFVVVIDGLMLIACLCTLCRWVMPDRFTVRTLLVVTAAVAFVVGTLA